MFAKLRLLAAAVLCCAASATASAAVYLLDITNHTGYTITYMSVSSAESELWEQNLLGRKVLPSGKRQRVTITGDKSPIYDIRLIDEEGDEYTFFNVDVSKDDITVTRDDLDD